MVIGIGGLIMLIGAIWMIVTAVKTESTTGSKVLWALVIFFLGAIGGTIYFFVRKAGGTPLILMWIGALLYGYGAFTSLSEMVR